jgi:lysophospholipase
MLSTSRSQVILTGAQIPLAELFTDAIDNLLGSLIIAGHYHIPEVCVFFDNKLLRGNRSNKASSEEFGAFESPNLPPLATVGIGIGWLTFRGWLFQRLTWITFTDVAWTEVLRPGIRAFRAHKSLSAKVGTSSVVALALNCCKLTDSTSSATLRIFPGISGSSVRAFLNADDVRGVVLESYGAGNAPRREDLLSAFREATDRGVVRIFPSRRVSVLL